MTKVTLENLKKLIGEEFDENNIICCFENVNDDVYVADIHQDWENLGHQYSKYNAYCETESFIINVDKSNNTIHSVYEA